MLMECIYCGNVIKITKTCESCNICNLCGGNDFDPIRK